MLTYSQQRKMFVWTGPPETAHIPKKAGFRWHPQGQRYVTESPFTAYPLRVHTKGVDFKLLRVRQQIDKSTCPDAFNGNLPKPEGVSYLPFQSSGIAHMADQLKAGRHAVGCMDEQGLGKTVQAIGVANALGLKRLLVICPASLALNWAREIEKWHIHNPGVEIVMNGKHTPRSGRTVITSYNLAPQTRDCEADLIIIDEAHYIKNHEAQRTQLVLGDAATQWPGLVNKAQTVFLSGTPLPNGKPNELWPILRRTAPDMLEQYKEYRAYIERFCRFQEDEYTGELVIRGAKNKEELFIRLRGSGFMTRRLKKDVLKDLPPKHHKMVVFTPTRGTREVMEQEKGFSAQEILEHGMPGELEDTRKAMGLAKVAQCLQYIENLLQGGTEKLVVFCHHLEVGQVLEAGLKKYGAVRIAGHTPVPQRQQHVDMFQNCPGTRVMIGNLQAAGVGFTLTKAHDVVFVEASWVPGENDQAADRCHRIGQLNGVLLHFLVVQGSLDAAILSSAARKKTDSSGVLDGG